MPFHSSPDADPINASAFGIFHVTLLTSSLSMFVRPSRGIHDPTDRLVRVGMVAARFASEGTGRSRDRPTCAGGTHRAGGDPQQPDGCDLLVELPLPDDIGVGQKLRGSAV